MSEKFSKLFKRDSSSKTVKEKRDLTMRHVLSVAKERTVPSWSQWRQVGSVLSKQERRIINLSIGAIILSLIWFGATYILSNRVEMPAVGGEYTEALVGEPQLINPIYALSNDVDADIASLVYSGLMKWDSQFGLIPDLAETIEKNEEGTVYKVTIREDAKFHNGDQVRASDVVFTVTTLQNPSYRSPLIGNFSNVTVAQEDDRTVSFVLDEPFAPFMQYLTVGILPSGLWSDVLPQNAPLAALNLQPVGSGPYKFSEFTKDKKGAVKSYTLERNEDYYNQAPFNEKITFKFYNDASSAIGAYQDKHVEGVNFIPFKSLEDDQIDNTSTVYQPNIHRSVTIFFNEDTNELLSETVVRKAIAQSIDKQNIVNNALASKATLISSFLLPDQIGGQSSDETTQNETFDPGAAKTALDEAEFPLPEGAEVRRKGGAAEKEEEPEESTEEQADEESASEETTDEPETDGEQSSEEVTDEEPTPEPEAPIEEEKPRDPNELVFVLSTVNSPEMIAVAEAIQKDLKNIGIQIDINPIAGEYFLTEVLEPRNFELLLTGVMVDIDPDPFVFWHSTQIDSPGLNLSGYANKEVDEAIEEARLEPDNSLRAQKYQAIASVLNEDTAAIYLYQSRYGYLLPNKIKGVDLSNLSKPSDRFNEIAQWYIKTKQSLR